MSEALDKVDIAQLISVLRVVDKEEFSIPCRYRFSFKSTNASDERVLAIERLPAAENESEFFQRLADELRHFCDEDQKEPMAFQLRVGGRDFHIQINQVASPITVLSTNEVSD